MILHGQFLSIISYKRYSNFINLSQPVYVLIFVWLLPVISRDSSKLIIYIIPLSLYTHLTVELYDT